MPDEKQCSVDEILYMINNPNEKNKTNSFVVDEIQDLCKLAFKIRQIVIRLISKKVTRITQYTGTISYTNTNATKQLSHLMLAEIYAKVFI